MLAALALLALAFFWVAMPETQDRTVARRRAWPQQPVDDITRQATAAATGM
jgi:hypothetical protein